MKLKGQKILTILFCKKLNKNKHFGNGLYFSPVLGGVVQISVKYINNLITACPRSDLFKDEIHFISD